MEKSQKILPNFIFVKMNENKLKKTIEIQRKTVDYLKAEYKKATGKSIEVIPQVFAKKIRVFFAGFG